MKQEQFNAFLLEALKNPAIIREIQSCTALQPEFAPTPAPAQDAEKTNKLKKRIEELSNQLNSTLESLTEARSTSETLSEENDVLTRKLNSESFELKNILSENSRLKGELSTREAEFQETQNKLSKYENQLQSATKETAYYKNTFGELISVYSSYLELSDATRRSLSNIISAKDTLAFVVSCSEYDNLQRLWDYNKTLAVSGTADELDTLVKVFDFFFVKYNSSRQEPRFIPDSTRPGDLFDDEEHIRGCGSKVSGRISEVVLRGYKNAVTGRIEKKSVVVVKGDK